MSPPRPRAGAKSKDGRKRAQGATTEWRTIGGSSDAGPEAQAGAARPARLHARLSRQPDVGCTGLPRRGVPCGRMRSSARCACTKPETPVPDQAPSRPARARAGLVPRAAERCRAWRRSTSVRDSTARNDRSAKPRQQRFCPRLRRADAASRQRRRAGCAARRCAGLGALAREGNRVETQQARRQGGSA